ncbi:hypothetical protein [Thermogemmatispora sp.]|uniref:hypothetical protein n=1 Tax=Thermogemmatispora sp. TaxID=1968838 RepID=UPI0035E45123
MSISGPIFMVDTSPVCRLIVALGKLWQTRPLLERRSQQARDSSSPGLLGLAAQPLRRWRKHAVPDERLPAEQWLLLLVAPALLGRLRRRRRYQPRREGLNEGRGHEKAPVGKWRYCKQTTGEQEETWWWRAALAPFATEEML